MKAALVCLHGWGGDKDSFTELRQALADSDIEILTPDLPGFGDESEPKESWTVDDYADWVEKYIAKNTDQPIALLGHSHGGRIAIKLASRGMKLEHLFLCAPAGIKHPRHIKRVIGLSLAKTGKFFLSIPGLRSLQPLGKKLLYKLIRVHDYERASPLMRQSLINVTREDLRPLLSKISVETDLFWGTADGMVPYSDAKIMESEIANTTLHTFKGARHRLHRDQAEKIATVIKKRLSP